MKQVGRSKADFYSEESEYEISYESGRDIKALKTVAILADAVKRPLSGLRALEIGCFTGEVSLRLSPRFREYVAIDLEEKNIARALQKEGAPNLIFQVMDAEAVAYPAGSFDVVICSHVYEHVHRPGQMMQEISRVLRPEGVCYFAAGNRLCLMEPHHRLPFLSFVPKPIANLYLGIFRGKSSYDEKFLLLPQLKKLVSGFFVQDYTLAVIQEPEKFMATDMLSSGTWKHAVASFLLPKLYPLIPTYIWILRKTASDEVDGR